MFLLDSNIFINAARLYYHPDIAPTFWNWLEAEHLKGNLASVERVKMELNDGDGKADRGYLQQWAAHLPATFWLKPDSTTPPSLRLVSSWATSKNLNYTQAAINEFLGVADYFLVAQAHAGKHHVVTFELPSPQSKKKILIPDACNALGVPYQEPFSVYRQLGLLFN